ncbi:MAG: sugar phosphate isomerase/epimerase, partial [Flavobacteriaceae bacterium]
MKIKSIVRNSALAGLAVIILVSYSCKQQKKSEQESTEVEVMSEAAPFFKLSLAQWSMHRMIREDGVDPYSFAQKAKEWGFSGLEYVSQLYVTELEASDYS